MQDLEKHIRYLEERIQHLEEVSRFTLDALEMAASLGNFQPSINMLQDTSLLLAETRLRIERLIRFQVTAFFIVDEETKDFNLVSVAPEIYGDAIRQEIDQLIDNGTFAWSLREKRPIIILSKNQENQLILHVMATSSRIRGMFIGMLGRERAEIPDISLSILSIILLNSSNALESFELYKMIREINKTLESKENYRHLFEAAPDGVEVLDALGRIVDCNKTLETLLGLGREAIIGKHTTNFFSASSKVLFESGFYELKRTGYFENEVRIVHCDGAEVPVWRKERAIYDDQGAFVGSVAYNHDLSLTMRAEEEKATLRAQLQRAQKMEALGTLAGGVAHDLNNILVGLVGYPELLLMKLSLDSPLRKPIEAIQRSGEKAAAIVQDLLTLARRGVPASAVLNLNDIIWELVRSPEYEKLRAAHPGIEVELHLEHALTNIIGSSVHLSKTIMNLISNAAEAMPSGGRMTISTFGRYINSPIRGYDEVREGRYAVLCIRDSGMGISSEDIDRIFEPFYTRKVMGRSGTGLGLAVVWGTVKDQGGYIDVESVPGEGSSFTLYFPATDEPLARPVEQGIKQALLGSGETVLVIDDAEEQREIATQMLTRLGYRALAVPSGEEALEFLKENKADLLVLDMILNQPMDGLDTYRKIVQMYPGQRAIIVSGYSETWRVKEAQRLGAGSYVKKPFLFEALATAVKNELARPSVLLGSTS